MAAKKTTAAKKTNATKTTDTKTTKKEPAAKDKLGCRVGSQSAAINATLTAKAKDVATIAEASGCTAARVRNHLRHLMAKELVFQVDDGYTTKAPAKRTRKAAS